MKKGPKRDWAERAAHKLLVCLGYSPSIDLGFYRRVLGALRRAGKREYERGKSDGYAEGHKDQMRMRVQDALERNARTRGQYSGNFS